KWKITHRPETYYVVVVAKLGAYTGPKSAEKTIKVPELVPVESPKILRPDVFNPADVYINFEPLPLDKLPGIDKGCKNLISEVYYASVECSTGAGPSPRSTWVPVETGKFGVGPAGKVTRRPIKSTESESDVDVSIKASGGMSIIVSWSFVMKNGSRFDQRHIKNLRVLHYSKGSDNAYSVRRTLTKDPTLRQIDAGLSPGYKFDLSCHFYAINVSFHSNRSAYETTEETCYSFVSPGFLILYATVLVVILLLSGIIFQVTKSRKTAAAQAGSTTTMSTTSGTTTSSSTTGVKRKGKSKSKSRSKKGSKKRSGR
ncbi:hypothetical protein GCK32_014557, partial [Trichostrongylus colubriformis]